MAWLDDNRSLFGLLELARTEERFAPIIRQGEEQAVADTLPHVKAAIAAGFVRREDPVVIAHAILGVTQQLARALVLDQGRPAPESERRGGHVLSRRSAVATAHRQREGRPTGAKVLRCGAEQCVRTVPWLQLRERPTQVPYGLPDPLFVLDESEPDVPVTSGSEPDSR